MYAVLRHVILFSSLLCGFHRKLKEKPKTLELVVECDIRLIVVHWNVE